MDWFGLLLGYVPLWAWISIAVLIAIPVLYFFGPILLPIFRMLPGWLQATLIGIGAALLAWAGGRHVGAKRERDEQKRREANALRTRAEVDQDVGNLSSKDLHTKLDRWNRPDD
jgi:membrane protein implicated in regulation of membrane protease activity